MLLARYDWTVNIEPLAIAGAWRIRPRVFTDNRGSFAEWFRSDHVESATGFQFSVAQANISRSARGVVRGIHYADVPPGQAKLVVPMSGRIIDYIVDIRVGSPTFGQWVSEELDSAVHDAVLIEPGLGHAFVACDDNALVSYLVTDVYRPEREHGINPFDSDLGLEFPADLTLSVSDKDRDAPSFASVTEAGTLPVWEER